MQILITQCCATVVEHIYIHITFNNVVKRGTKYSA